jgi:hypothetical protein
MNFLTNKLKQFLGIVLLSFILLQSCDKPEDFETYITFDVNGEIFECTEVNHIESYPIAGLSTILGSDINDTTIKFELSFNGISLRDYSIEKDTVDTDVFSEPLELNVVYFNSHSGYYAPSGHITDSVNPETGNSMFAITTSFRASITDMGSSGEYIKGTFSGEISSYNGKMNIENGDFCATLNK